MARRGQLLLAVGLGVGLLGCAVGPEYRRPPVPVPAEWSHAAQPGVTAAPAALGAWWRTLEDPILDALITRALGGNLDLRIAAARVREARATRGVIGADRFPTVETVGEYARVRNSEHVPPHPAAPEFNLFQAGFDASWELDVFGHVRRAVEAADADLHAAEEARRDVWVTVLAEVARTYVEVRAAQQRIDIADANIRTQADTVRLTEVRRTAGLASDLDVDRARAQLEATRAQPPVFEAARAQGIHRLGVLLGTPPETLLAELGPPTPIPAGHDVVPVGLPSDLLRRRADVRRAERELAAATARIGVATADLFPRFSLTGTLGLASDTAGQFFTPGSRFFSVGPQVLWPIFDAGRIRANIRVQTAREEAAVAGYTLTVLGALEEVETTLVRYGQEQVRRQRLAEAVAANRRALELATEVYTRGLADFLTVLEAQRALYTTEDDLAQSDQAVTVDLIALYKALGGGWEHVEPSATAAPGPTPPSTAARRTP